MSFFGVDLFDDLASFLAFSLIPGLSNQLIILILCDHIFLELVLPVHLVLFVDEVLVGCVVCFYELDMQGDQLGCEDDDQDVEGDRDQQDEQDYPP